MNFLRRHWLLVLLFLAWLPLAITLSVSFPTQERAAKMSSALLSMAEQGKGALKYMDEADQQELKKGVAFLSDPQNILREWQVNWMIQSVVLFIGLGSVLLAIQRTRGWKLGLVIASGCYLFFVASFPFLRASRWEQWQAWWILATYDLTWGIPTIYQALAFPLFHAILIIFLVTNIVLSKKRHMGLDDPRA